MGDTDFVRPEFRLLLLKISTAQLQMLNKLDLNYLYMEMCFRKVQAHIQDQARKGQTASAAKQNQAQSLVESTI